MLRQEGLVLGPPSLKAQRRFGAVPLSFAQERLWLLDRLEALGSTYNIAVAVRLQGRLDVAALERSFADLIRRHEVLRARFTAQDGGPVQVIEPAGPFGLEVEDLCNMARVERAAASRRRVGEIAAAPFDLERGPLLRVHLLALSVEEHVAVVVLHHIVADGWSLGILIRELGALYAAFVAGKPSPLVELPVQYADYAIWQRQWISGEVLAAQAAYWKERLSGAPAAMALPIDHARPAVQSFKGAAYRFTLSREIAAALAQLARSEGATLFMVVLAAFQVLLSRWSGQQDVVVGTPIAGRTQRQCEGLIGCFVNTLALRTDLSGDPSFRELVRRVKETALGAYAHQDLPFEKLVEELQPVRDLSRQPIFQVLFALQNMSRERLQLPGLQLSRTDAEHVTAKFDLSLYLQEAEHGWGGIVEYATELFERSTIERFVGHFQTLLAGIAAEPDCPVSGLPLLGKAERHRLLVEWNDTAADYPSDKCVHELFAAQAARTPDAVAVLYEGQHLTYGELDQRSNQLAHHLRALGVGPEVVVGLCLERSLDMVVGLLGILKAGGAYLPLDPEYPQERLAYMLTDARAPVVVTQAPLTARLTAHPAPLVRLDTQWEDIARQPESMPASETCPNNLAYLIYTSGSTGKPKGVMIHHGAVVNFLRSMATTPGIDAIDVLAAVTPLSFDIAVLEIYLALIVGARIAVIPRDVALDGSRLRQRLETVGATIAQATPATWRMLCEAGWEGRTLKVLCGGDALSLDLARMLTARSAATWNLYGPTEATIWSAAARVDADRPLTIGGPIANTQIHILDARLELMPIGVPGELYLAGVGLARGYFGRPALTAERFLPSPFGNGERLYRTGDLARWRSDGGLEFLGRIDHQVKLRGYRIEPGEIEAALRQHAGVKDAVVVAGEDSSGEKQLGAYVVVQDAAPDPTELRSYLRKSLPDYMVPSTILPLDALPMTPNGKVDRKALPVPVPRAQSREYLAPRTPTEAALAEIWSDLLAVERVGADDNFFDLGGHSLLGMRAIERVRKAFAVELPLRALFEVPDLRGLAARIDETPLISAESTRVVASGRQQARPWFLSDEGGESARPGA
jgi:amino acid adenylation domain-containing protein